MSNKVIHFEVQADDVSRAKEFYEKAFGWKISQAMSKEKGDPMDYWMLETGPREEPGISGGLYQRTPENPLHTYDCTILVEDIDKAVADVKANGGTILREKSLMEGIGWFAAGQDTEGNKFGLMQATDWKA
ncbi:MAG: uncharacterized protein QG642_518 [Patescibacteria group bacterium]|nr:uncharacterized protein [Patescibacteria group bacterium]